jgi:transposase
MAQSWQPSKWTRQQQEERRLYAQPYLISGELSTAQIAERAGVSASTVRTRRRRLRLRESLEATRATGRPPHLSDAQVAEIMSVLQAGPDVERYPDQRWTCPRVRDLIGERQGVWYDVDHVRRLLHRWGFSPQKPEKRALERNEEAIGTWLDVRVPVLEKKMEGWAHVGVRR